MLKSNRYYFIFGLIVTDATEDTINSGMKPSISAEFRIQFYFLLWRNTSPVNPVPQFGNHWSIVNKTEQTTGIGIITSCSSSYVRSSNEVYHFCIRITYAGRPRPHVSQQTFPQQSTGRHSQGRATVPSIQPSNVPRRWGSEMLLLSPIRFNVSNVRRTFDSLLMQNIKANWGQSLDTIYRLIQN
jgi:hypothetical protein